MGRSAAGGKHASALGGASNAARRGHMMGARSWQIRPPRRPRCWRMTSSSSSPLPGAADRWCRRSTRARSSPSIPLRRWRRSLPASAISRSTLVATTRRSWRFEAKLAALEGTEAARGFASGMAAISSTVLAFLAAGERMVAVRHCYPDAYRLFRRLLPRLGIEVDLRRWPRPRRCRRSGGWCQAALSGKPDQRRLRDPRRAGAGRARQGCRRRLGHRQQLGHAALPATAPARRRPRHPLRQQVHLRP